MNFKKNITGLVSKIKNMFSSSNEYMKESKNSLFITIFGGWFGLHHYLRGNILKGLLYTFTFGLLFVGYYIDCVSECMSYPDPKKIMLFRCYCIAFFLIYVFISLHINVFISIVFLLSVLLYFCSFWGKFGFTKWRISYLFPLFLFALVVNEYFRNSSVPFGEWISSSDEVKYYVLYYKNNDYRLYESKDSEDYIKVKYESSDGILSFKKDNEILASFVYDFEKKEMCLLDEEDKCSVIYELKEEDE